MSERDEATSEALLFQAWGTMIQRLSANDLLCQHLFKILKSIYVKQLQYKLHEGKSAGVTNTVDTLKDFASWFVIDVWTHPTEMMHYGGIDILSVRAEDSQCCGSCATSANRYAMKKFCMGLPMRSVRYILITPRPLMHSIINNLLWINLTKNQIRDNLTKKQVKDNLTDIIISYIDGK